MVLSRMLIRFRFFLKRHDSWSLPSFLVKPTDGIILLLFKYRPENEKYMRNIHRIAYENNWYERYTFGRKSNYLPISIVIFAYLLYARTHKNNIADSKASYLVDQKDTLFLEDVVGVDHLTDELTFYIDWLKDPSKINEYGIKVPRGMLFSGPPGCGKTMLAKAIAHEAKVPFFYLSASELDQLYVGAGSKKLRGLFDDARKLGKGIIFIDEIDSIARKRSPDSFDKMKELTTNQLLSELDGFKNSDGILVIAATNRPEDIDPSLVRSGRFDVKINIPLPNSETRKLLFIKKLQFKPFLKDIDLDHLAKISIGWSGADIENFVNQCALALFNTGENVVSDDIIESVRMKMVNGKARDHILLSNEIKKRSAYCEAGKVIASRCLTPSNEVIESSIKLRSDKVGKTSFKRDENNLTSISNSEIDSKIVMELSGRASEELTFGADNLSTHSEESLGKASEYMENKIMIYGLGSNYEVIDNDALKYISQRRLKELNHETKAKLNSLYELSKQIIVYNYDQVSLIAEKLLEKEELSLAEINELLNGSQLNTFDLTQ